ncbi:MAG: putative photosynthetic complex assembly protein PuhE [Pseudomonadota bacterium]
MQIAAAVLVACFVWWAATGAILYVVKRADAGLGSYRAPVFWTAPAAVLGAGVLWWSTLAPGAAPGTAQVYGGFFGAIALWGWFELAFLAGVITGPNRFECPRGIPEFERFVRAWGTIAYSEMALAAIALSCLALLREAESTIGLWTFLVLFFARISAKLNVWMGVPNINVEFLPRPVAHVASHFRVAPMNPLFPATQLALALAMGFWIERAATAQGSDAVGFTLLAVLTALAFLEHWMMVLPLQDAKLWAWLIRFRQVPHDKAKGAAADGL